jgi:hypothetical protein
MRKQSEGISFELESNVPVVNKTVEVALRRALDRIAIRWQAAARQQTPVDTGRLRSSIAFSTPNQPALGTGVDELNQGLTAIVGTNVEYALAVHEGFSGRVNVQEHTREIKTAFGRAIAPKRIRVKAHTRHMTRTANKFIETPGRQLLSTFQNMVNEEVTKATRGRS